MYLRTAPERRMSGSAGEITHGCGRRWRKSCRAQTDGTRWLDYWMQRDWHRAPRKQQPYIGISRIAPLHGPDHASVPRPVDILLGNGTPEVPEHGAGALVADAALFQRGNF